MAQVTKDMIISDIIGIDTNIIPILMRAGMHCIGCPSAQGEAWKKPHSYMEWTRTSW